MEDRTQGYPARLFIILGAGEMGSRGVKVYVSTYCAVIQILGIWNILVPKESFQKDQIY